MMSRKFTREQDLLLIKLVGQNESLYDYTNRCYKSRTTRTAIWTDIGNVMGKSGNECKIRWRSIRDQYFKLNHKTKWELYDSLSFLETIRHFREQRLTSSRHDSWLTAIGRDPNIERLAKSNLICSEHFEKKDMIRKNNKLKLKKETIPKLKLGPRKPETKFRQSNFARKSDQITNSSEELQITRVESVKKKRKISRIPREKYHHWMQIIGRVSGSTPAYNRRICSEHFTNDSFFLAGDKKCLVGSAIPSLNLREQKVYKFKSNIFSAPVKSQQGSSSSVDYTESRNVKFEDTSNNGFKNYQMKVEIEDPVLQCGITDYNLQQNEIADRGISPGNIYTSTRGIKRDDDEDDIFSETEVVQLNIKRSSIPKVENRTTEDFEFIPCSIMDEGPNSDAFIVEEGVEEKVDDQTEFDDFDVFMANLEEKLKKLPEHLIEEAKTNILSYVSTLELSSSNLS